MYNDGIIHIPKEILRLEIIKILKNNTNLNDSEITDIVNNVYFIEK